MGKEVRAVFFDLDDTLVPTLDADKSAFNAVLLFLSDRLASASASAMAIVDTFKEGFNAQPWDPHHQIDVTEWRSLIWNKALQKEGVDNMELARELQSCFDQERMLAFRWAEGVELMVKKLQATGIKVGIITNGHSKVQRAKLEACQASKLFNTILVGGEEPKQKPHKEIFLKACELLGCKPEQAMMVGDNLQTDIRGAFDAGFLVAVWVNIHDVPEIPLGEAMPHYTISNIGGVHEVFQQLGLLHNC